MGSGIVPNVAKAKGTYYKGYKLSVLAAAGPYVLDVTIVDRAMAVVAVSVITDKYGAGDYFKLEHLNASDVVTDRGGIASTMYNIGKNVEWYLGFPALELMEVGHKFRLTYTNVAGIAMNVYMHIERIR